MLSVQKHYFFSFLPKFFTTKTRTKEEGSSNLLGWKIYTFKWFWFSLRYKKFTGEKYEFVKIMEPLEDMVNYPADIQELIPLMYREPYSMVAENGFTIPPGHACIYRKEDSSYCLYRKIA